MAADDDLPASIHALTERVARLVRSTLPDAEERVYRDGASRGYHARGAGALFGLFPRPGAVYVSFPPSPTRTGSSTPNAATSRSGRASRSRKRHSPGWSSRPGCSAGGSGRDEGGTGGGRER